MEESSLAYKVVWSGRCNLGPALSPASPPRAVLVSSCLVQSSFSLLTALVGIPSALCAQGLRSIQR